MKTNYLVYLATVLLLSLLIACEKNVEQKPIDVNDDKVQLLEKLKDAREVAKFHSEGLEFAYKRLKNSTKSTSSNQDNVDKIAFILNTTSDFLAASNISQKLSPYNIFNVNTSSLKSAKNNQQYDENLIPFKDLNVEIKDFLDEIIPEIDDLDNIDDEITKSILYLESNMFFQTLSEEWQNAVILYLATFEDSFKYWRNNYLKWHVEPTQTRGIKDWWNRNKGTVMTVVNADCKGAISGAVGGAIGGAAAGSVVGGVGAVPGAIAGGVGSGVGVAITTSMMEAMNHEAKQSSGDPYFFEKIDVGYVDIEEILLIVEPEIEPAE